MKVSSGEDNILLVTKLGLANRFSESAVRAMGRTARGVRGIKLSGDDEVMSIVVTSLSSELLTITKKGHGKRTVVTDYRLCNRGGKGVINLKVTEKTGPVVDAKLVEGDEQLMLMSKGGIAIRISVTDVPTIGRATQGVKVMRFKSESDHIAAVALIASEHINGDSEQENSSKEGVEREETESEELTDDQEVQENSEDNNDKTNPPEEV